MSGALATLYRCELRMLLRDRRTVVVSVVLPLLVMPLFFYLASLGDKARQERQAETTYRYAVTGPAQELARRLIAAGASRDEDGATEAEGGVHAEPLLRLEEAASDDPVADLAAQELHVVVVAHAAVAAPESPVAEAVTLPRVELLFHSNWTSSSVAAGEVEQRLERARRERRRAVLSERGFPVPASAVAEVVKRDVATAEQVTGATVGRFAALFVLLFLASGGSVVAADAIAGEKERGTLETLLTTAIDRRELVLAKLLTILTVGVVITVVQLVNLLVYVGLGLLEVPASFAVDASPATLALLLVLFLPLATLTAGVLLWTSGRAKTYKEFQSLFLPVLLLLMLPAGAALLPGAVLRSAVVAVPIANLSVGIREVLVGRIDPLFLALAWIVTTLAAAAVVYGTLRSLSTERLISASELDRADWRGGAELFPRRVLGWYAVAWVGLFLALTNVGALQDLYSQLLFNLVVVFLGGSLLLVGLYRLPPRAALALRPVRPAVWPAVLLGAPALLLTGVALARLSAALFPVPQRMVEAFGEALSPAGLSFVELLLLVAVLPGICEELAFRGVLLYGLRRRFSPAVLCLVVGVVFGLYHVDLFRFLPTAFLGTGLAAVTLLTGSVYPAMVWHALNNAAALTAQRYGVDLEQLDPWLYAAGAAGATLAFAWLWRVRTPYPGLRRKRRSASELSGL